MQRWAAASGINKPSTSSDQLVPRHEWRHERLALRPESLGRGVILRLRTWRNRPALVVVQPRSWPATWGDDARYTIVSAPFSGEIAPSFREAHQPLADRAAGGQSPNRVATNPGCRELAVTPVPAKRLASARVNRMLQSFDRRYA